MSFDKKPQRQFTTVSERARKGAFFRVSSRLGLASSSAVNLEARLSRGNFGVLGRLEIENAELRRRAVDLALDIQELAENRIRYN